MSSGYSWWRWGLFRASLVTAVVLGSPSGRPQANLVQPIGDVYCHAVTLEPRYFYSGVDRPTRESTDEWWSMDDGSRRVREERTLGRLAGAFSSRVSELHGVDVLLSPRCERTPVGVAESAISAAAYAQTGELVPYEITEKVEVDWTPAFERAFRAEVGAGSGTVTGAPAVAGRSGGTEHEEVVEAARLRQVYAAGLHVAAAAADVGAAVAAIARGADVRGRNEAGETPLDVAAAADAAGVVNLLVAHGVDPAVLDRSLRERPLHRAARTNATAAAAALLAHGASVNVVNAAGETPLHAAAEVGAIGVASVLLAHGANTELRDRENRTPRDIALAAGASGVVALLPVP